MEQRRNPPRVPADTSPEVWVRQMAAVAARTVSDRLDEWEALNRAVSQMEADGIRHRHPEYDDEQVHRAQVRLRCGDELARHAWPGSELIDP